MAVASFHGPSALPRHGPFERKFRDYIRQAVAARIEQDLARRPEHTAALTGDPVLDERWNNPDDAVYDHPGAR